MGIDTARNQKKEKHQRFAAETGVFDRIINPDFIFSISAGNTAMQEQIFAEDARFAHRAANDHGSKMIAGVESVIGPRASDARRSRIIAPFNADADILGGNIGYPAVLRKRFAAIDAGGSHIPQTAAGQPPGVEVAQESVFILLVIIRRNDARLTQIAAIHASKR